MNLAELERYSNLIGSNLSDFIIAEGPVMNESIKREMTKLTNELLNKLPKIPRSLFHCSYMKLHNGKDWKNTNEYISKEISKWMRNI